LTKEKKRSSRCGKEGRRSEETGLTVRFRATTIGRKKGKRIYCSGKRSSLT